jgi:hypothetical protein
MKRILVMVALALAMVPAVWRTAEAAEIRVELYTNNIQGLDWPAAVMVFATLRDKTGAVKGYSRKLTSGTGSWNVTFADDTLILPGDQATISVGATMNQHTFSQITVTKVNPRKNLLGLKVSPPKGTLGYQVVRSVLTPLGWIDEDIRHTEASPDGTFLFDTTAVIDLRRRDFVALGYQEGVFNVFRLNRVPGLTVELGSPSGWVTGMSGRQYQVGLLNGAGVLKGKSPAFIADGWFLNDEISFLRPRGTPVPIQPGDRIQVQGPSGFQARVPAIEVSAVPISQTATGTAPPGAVVYVHAELYLAGVYLKGLQRTVTADAVTGAFSATWPGETIDIGDYLQAEIQDADGNIFVREEQVHY